MAGGAPLVSELAVMITPLDNLSANSEGTLVGQLMRSIDTVDTFDSLIQTSVRLRDNGIDLIPVVKDGKFVGVVTEASLAKAIASKFDWTGPATTAMVDAPTLTAEMTGTEALRILASSGLSAMTVVDRGGQVMGVLSATCFSPVGGTENRPMMVGGMATPFGVYLTNGVVGAGARGFPLVLTGFVLFILLLTAQVATKTFETHYAEQIPLAIRPITFALIPTLLFFLLMRLIPLSGTHGAEHQVVHAIERGEPLVPEIVTRMPRVHPRCGTNVAVGASVFLAITQVPWIASQEIRVAVGLLATLFLWQPIGNFLQAYVTTRKPSFKQLHSGISAGKELIAKAATVKNTKPNLVVKLYSSGMLHVMFGSALCYGAARLVQVTFQIDLGLE
jgi:CBS domain-containing protein